MLEKIQATCEGSYLCRPMEERYLVVGKLAKLFNVFFPCQDQQPPIEQCDLEYPALVLIAKVLDIPEQKQCGETAPSDIPLG